MAPRRRLRRNPQIRLHNPELERRLIRSRILLATVLASVWLLGTGLRLYDLQVHSHAHFATLSQGNRVRLRPLPPPRGLIYDRQGILLAENLPSFRLEIVPGRSRSAPDAGAPVPAGRNHPAGPRALRARTQAQPAVRRHPLRHRLTDEEVARLAIDRIHFPVSTSAPISRATIRSAPARPM